MQKYSPAVLQKCSFSKFYGFHRIKHGRNLFLEKVVDYRLATVLKKTGVFPYRCFPVNFVKLFRLFFYKTSPGNCFWKCSAAVFNMESHPWCDVPARNILVLRSCSLTIKRYSQGIWTETKGARGAREILMHDKTSTARYARYKSMQDTRYVRHEIK